MSAPTLIPDLEKARKRLGHSCLPKLYTSPKFDALEWGLGGGRRELKETRDALVPVRAAVELCQNSTVAEIQRLIDAATGPGSTTSPRGETDAEVSPVQAQIVHAELPLVLGHQLKGLEFGESLMRQGACVMTSLIAELVDGDGWIAARFVGNFGALLASWCRSATLCHAANIDLNSITPDADQTLLKLEWMVRQCLRLCGPDGRLMLSDTNTPRLQKPFWKALLRLSTDAIDERLARLRVRGTKAKPRDGLSERHADDGSFSEWAGVGVLQSGWSRKSPRVGFALHADRIGLEIANQNTLIVGDSMPEILVGDQQVAPTPDGFSVNCHHSGPEAEFLEVEYFLEPDVRLQRQILVAREDNFMILADAVLLPESAPIRYALDLQLANDIGVIEESETTEIYLCSDGSIRALALPLMIGEWKQFNRLGSMRSVESGKSRAVGTSASLATASAMRLVCHGAGAAFYAPLFIDLDSKRSHCPRTWRTLTVAEDMKVVPRDQAVAWRIQVGGDQWVVYKSLNGSTANRTFLGENHICDFYVGRFDGDTECEALIQVT